MTTMTTAHEGERQQALQASESKKSRLISMQRRPCLCYLSRRAFVRVLVSTALLLLMVSIEMQTPVVIMLIPTSQMVMGTYQFTAVMGEPHPGQRQVKLRHITSSLPSQQSIVYYPANMPKNHAVGQVTIINTSAQPITLSAFQVIGKSGIPVLVRGPITIPDAPPDVVAFGFVLTDDIDQRSEIDTIARMSRNALQQNAQMSIQHQVRKNERVIDGSLDCRSTAITVLQSRLTVITVSAIYNEETYDYHELRILATKMLEDQKMNNSLGSSYRREGQLMFHIQNGTPAPAQQTLNVEVWGQWTYHFSATRLSQLANRVAGQDEADARAWLLRQPGIADVHFSHDDNHNRLPAANEVLIIVV